MAIADVASAALARSHHHFNRVLPPEHRQRAWDRVAAFAEQRPLLFVRTPSIGTPGHWHNQHHHHRHHQPYDEAAAHDYYHHPAAETDRPAPRSQAFLTTQALFSTLPVLLFVSFLVSTVVFALGSALLFILFWLALGLSGLITSLLFTGSFGFCIWAWAAALYYAARWAYGLVAPHLATVREGDKEKTNKAEGVAEKNAEVQRRIEAMKAVAFGPRGPGPDGAHARGLEHAERTYADVAVAPPPLPPPPPPPPAREGTVKTEHEHDAANGTQVLGSDHVL